jgi:hypothetical protein
MAKTPKSEVSGDWVKQLREAKRLKDEAEREAACPLGWSWAASAEVDGFERLEESQERLEEGWDCGWENYFSAVGQPISGPLQMFVFDVLPEDCRNHRTEAETFLGAAFGDKNVSGGPGLLRGFAKGAVDQYHAATQIAQGNLRPAGQGGRGLPRVGSPNPEEESEGLDG